MPSLILYQRRQNDITTIYINQLNLLKMNTKKIVKTIMQMQKLNPQSKDNTHVDKEWEWRLEPFGRSKFEKVLYIGNEKICSIDFGYIVSLERAEAFAALMSQAPVMYKALLPFFKLGQEVLDIKQDDQIIYEFNGAKITTQDLKNVLLVMFKANPNL